MNDRVFIKPAAQPAGQPPLKVRKPVGGHLPEGGDWVNLDSYWQRRINDGDVVVDTTATPEGEATAGSESAAKQRK